MAGTDDHGNSGSRRINMKIWGVQTPSFMFIGTADIELRCLQGEEKHGQNGGNIFGYNFHIWCFFTAIFGILFSFHIFRAVKLLEVTMT